MTATSTAEQRLEELVRRTFADEAIAPIGSTFLVAVGDDLQIGFWLHSESPDTHFVASCMLVAGMPLELDLLIAMNSFNKRAVRTVLTWHEGYLDCAATMPLTACAHSVAGAVEALVEFAEEHAAPFGEAFGGQVWYGQAQ